MKLLKKIKTRVKRRIYVVNFEIKNKRGHFISTHHFGSDKIAYWETPFSHALSLLSEEIPFYEISSIAVRILRRKGPCELDSSWPRYPKWKNVEKTEPEKVDTLLERSWT